MDTKKRHCKKEIFNRHHLKHLCTQGGYDLVTCPWRVLSYTSVLLDKVVSSSLHVGSGPLHQVIDTSSH